MPTGYARFCRKDGSAFKPPGVCIYIGDIPMAPVEGLKKIPSTITFAKETRSYRQSLFEDKYIHRCSASSGTTFVYWETERWVRDDGEIVLVYRYVED